MTDKLDQPGVEELLAQTTPNEIQPLDSQHPEQLKALDDSEIFRDQSTAVTPAPEISAEQAKLAAERAALKQARDAALATTAVPPQVVPADPVAQQSPSVVPAPGNLGTTVMPTVQPPVPIVEKIVIHSNDRFAGSLGLLIVRLVAAFTMGVYGYYHLTHIAEIQDLFAQTLLVKVPYYDILAIATAVAEVAIAVALVLGLATRLAGFGMALITGAALTFYWWGQWNILHANEAGFQGELDLMLAAVGLMFLFLGAGGASIDRGMRKARARKKAARKA